MRIIRQQSLVTTTVVLALAAFSWGIYGAYQHQKDDAKRAKQISMQLEHQLSAEQTAVQDLQQKRDDYVVKAAQRKRRIDKVLEAAPARAAANQTISPVLQKALQELRDEEGLNE